MRYLGFFILIVLYGCAQITPLSGGPKDSFAPAIDSAKTYPSNGQTNFKGNEIEMRFNEFISLKNPNDNIIIIPQQETPPDIYAKNKKLSIVFNDEMMENTTYTITFNGAIQDITEKNDSVFQYVFSTGNYIDSLSVTGTVKDAFTNLPQKQFLVGLYPKSYEANFDSIPFKFKPMYLSQTDGSGIFELNYLKDGTYYIFAIKDQNKNLLYDQGEEIAFIEEQSFLLSATNQPDLDLRSFGEPTSEIYVEDVRFEFPGKLEVILSNPTDSIEITSNLGLLQEDTGSEDSLIYWLDQPPVKKMRFYLDLKGELDTLKPIYENVPDKIETVKLKDENNVKQGKLLPGENLQITFSEPIKSIDTAMIRFFDADSNRVSVSDFEIKVRTVEFKTFGTAVHEVILDSAAVISVFDRSNDKDIKVLFDNEAEDFYGTIIVTVDTTFSEPVIVHLLDKESNVVDTMDFAQKMIFEKVLPGDYQLRLIFDVDNSGDWTAGSLSEGKEPEDVIYNNSTFNVKSKWEKEVEWLFSKE